MIRKFFSVRWHYTKTSCCRNAIILFLSRVS
nr:MAG TPA: hypothetical protein [Caudoviricetes sp.]